MKQSSCDNFQGWLAVVLTSLGHLSIKEKWRQRSLWRHRHLSISLTSKIPGKVVKSWANLQKGKQFKTVLHTDQGGAESAERKVGKDLWGFFFFIFFFGTAARIRATIRTYHIFPLKVYSGRAPRLKKVIWDSQILADFSNRSTVKSIKKFVWDFKKSGSLYVWEFDMNRPLSNVSKNPQVEIYITFTSVMGVHY